MEQQIRAWAKPVAIFLSAALLLEALQASHIGTDTDEMLGASRTCLHSNYS